MTYFSNAPPYSYMELLNPFIKKTKAKLSEIQVNSKHDSILQQKFREYLNYESLTWFCIFFLHLACLFAAFGNKLNIN